MLNGHSLWNQIINNKKCIAPLEIWALGHRPTCAIEGPILGNILILDIYENFVMKVRSSCGGINEFRLKDYTNDQFKSLPICIVLVWDTKEIQENASCCMMFTNDIVLTDTSKENLEFFLKVRRYALESKCLKLKNRIYDMQL